MWYQEKCIRADTRAFSPDCASSRIWLKQKLRHFEHLLLTCEKWSAIAWLLGVLIRQMNLRDNWKKVLWGAFHDVVPGTAMDEAYEEIKDSYSYLRSSPGPRSFGFPRPHRRVAYQ